MANYSNQTMPYAQIATSNEEEKVRDDKNNTSDLSLVITPLTRCDQFLNLTQTIQHVSNDSFFILLH